MKKLWKALGATLLALLVVWLICFLLPRPQNFKLDNPMRKEGIPQLIAHGGGNREFPDNTLEAFYNAYDVDPNVMLETDVNITKDGVVILSHDTTLDRKTNVSGKIADWNYTDLIDQRVDFGYTNQTTEEQVLVEGSARVKFATADGRHVTPLDVPYPEGVQPRDSEVFLATTLEELLIAFPENLINLEIKQSGEVGMRCLREVLRLLKAYDAWEHVVLASFHEELYDEYVRLQKSGEVPATFMYSPATDAVTQFVVLHLLGLDVFFQDGVAAFQLPLQQSGVNLSTAYLVDTAHRHNIAVQYWTINDPEEMRHLIKIGADGIMTDYPHLLAQVYAEYAE